MKFLTLKSQTVEAIRERIVSRAWTDTLPREKEIARTFGVSRNTVRGAISALMMEGLIVAGGRGIQHAINSSKATPARKSVETRQPVRVVRFLSSQPFHELGELSGTIYTSLLEHLRPEGFRLVLEVQVGLLSRFSAAKLKRITSEGKAVGWILHRQSRQVQEWFAASGIPTVVVGSNYPGIDLPSIRFDYASSSRHAVLEFVRRGHTRIAFVTPRARIASEQESVEGFLAVKAEHRALDLHLIEHDGTTQSISSAVIASRFGTSPVTAYYTMGCRSTIAVYTTLLHAGLRVPEHAALICRAGDGHLGSINLPISHYYHDGPAMGRTAAKMLSRVIRFGPGAEEQKDLFPVYVRGQSV